MSDDRPITASGGWCAPSETVYDLAHNHSPSLEPGQLLTKEGHLVTSPNPTVREMLARHTRRADLWSGRAEPTDEERRIVVEALMREHESDLAAYQRTQRFLAIVDAWKPTGLPKAILDLHDRTVHDECTQCGDEYPVQWPCPTARLVLHDNFIEVPLDLTYEEPAEPIPDPDNPRWPFPAGPVDPLGTIDIPSISVAHGGATYPERSAP